MITALLGAVLLAAIAGLGAFALLALTNRLGDGRDRHVEAVLACLPRTECAQCGYPGCRPYAEAVLDGAAINLCPPGGEATVTALSALLDRPAAIPECGHAPGSVTARIVEPDCIGCTLCIAACPVDAIFGAARFMHTVITSECTGCELCIPPCPVDCIELIDVISGNRVATA